MPLTKTMECKRRLYASGRRRIKREPDYAYARKHVRPSHQTPYERVNRTDLLRRNEGRDLARSFREQVERWKDETAHLASETKAIAHPSYLRIIGLAKGSAGREIERLLLQELE